MARLKICLVASSGGHLTELLKLSSTWKQHEVTFITTLPMVRADLRRSGAVYVVGECNRQHPWKSMGVLIRCIRIMWRERPDVVMSTGAAAGCMSCLLGKVLGAKIVWLDSITNVDRLSFSGSMVRHISDLFLVQWPGLAGRYKRVEFIGAVI
ncbi:MAG: hypothetical protein P8Z79_11750 [Sedimentisphaerales bacterium]|jgi:UDP-N-acetylglucosamine:LPS N-acetylglucosamine transferase